MKRWTWALLLLIFAFAFSTRAQMGMDLFKRPAIMKAFHPVIGKGAEYQTTSKAKVDTMVMAIVGKESVAGKDGYWMEFVFTDDRGQTIVGKSLVTVDDFQPRRSIMQLQGQPAMEMPVSATSGRSKIEDNLADWHSVGTETVSVPAGTFSCDHWKNDKTGGEVWTSDKVSPYGMVKEMSKDHTTVLTKVMNDFQDRITGPVQTFDPQQLMRQAQQQRQ